MSTFGRSGFVNWRVVLRIILIAFFLPIELDESDDEQLLIRIVHRDFENPGKDFLDIKIAPYLLADDCGSNCGIFEKFKEFYVGIGTSSKIFIELKFITKF